MKVVISDRLRRCTPPAIRLWMTQGWLRISPGCGCGFGGRCEQRLTSGLPKPDYGPVRQFDSLGYSLRHLCRDIVWVSPSPASAAAHATRQCPPKNIATFNTHTETPEPMAGAFFTRYDALS